MTAPVDSMPLPSTIPLFPLPNVVLFPQVLLPLHIFEPRYREMVRDAAAGDELIGMILLRGPETPGRGDDVYRVGCAGRMVRKVELPDGRSNILLQGLREFVPVEQHFDRPYRTGTVEWLPAPEKGFRLDPPLRDALVERIRAAAGEAGADGLRILSDPTLSDEMLVNLFAFALDLPVVEKQGLLEIERLADRGRQLLETLEFHAIEREFAPSSEGTKPRVQ
jgi:Lon protease-like protein